jgi:hypothetical protein
MLSKPVGISRFEHEGRLVLHLQLSEAFEGEMQQSSV